jgi:hypothetical protein
LLKSFGFPGAKPAKEAIFSPGRRLPYEKIRYERDVHAAALD